MTVGGTGLEAPVRRTGALLPRRSRRPLQLNAEAFGGVRYRSQQLSRVHGPLVDDVHLDPAPSGSWLQARRWCRQGRWVELDKATSGGGAPGPAQRSKVKELSGRPSSATPSPRRASAAPVRGGGRLGRRPLRGARRARPPAPGPRGVRGELATKRGRGWLGFLDRPVSALSAMDMGWANPTVLAQLDARAAVRPWSAPPPCSATGRRSGPVHAELKVQSTRASRASGRRWPARQPRDIG